METRVTFLVCTQTRVAPAVFVTFVLLIIIMQNELIKGVSRNPRIFEITGGARCKSLQSLCSDPETYLLAQLGQYVCK